MTHHNEYVMIDLAQKLACKLEDMGHRSEAADAHLIAEYLERKLVPIEHRRS